jgi:predicted nucleic acid-binding protein
MSGAGAPVVVLDTSVVIAFREPADAHHAEAVVAFSRHQADELVLPASAYAEALVGPCRRGAAAVASFERFISDLAVRVEPLTREIARQAAHLRSHHASLRLPDALVLATGDVLDAGTVLTADTAWPKVSRRARVI